MKNILVTGRVRRAFVVAAASAAMVAVPGSLAIATGVGTAGAAGSSVTCAKISGSATGTITVKSCLPKDKLNKSGSFAASALASGSGTLTWAKSGGTTTLGSVHSTPVAGTACGKKATEYTATGTVTGGTSTYTHAGDAFTADVCINTTTLAIKGKKGSTVGL